MSLGFNVVFYSFLGWIIEGLHHLFVEGSFLKPNFLFAPLKPMYGIAAVFLLYARVYGGKTFFLWALILPLAVEYVTGLWLKLRFGLVYWDYSALPFNFQGIICLPYALAWVMLAYILTDYLHPKLKKFYLKHQTDFLPGAICAVVLFVADIIATLFYRGG